jgi:hypothetical protein
MWRLGLVLACGVWLGCAPEETFRTGSRLQLQWLVAEDGAKVFTGFFDAELGTRCEPKRMTDDVVRCVPTLGPGASGSLLAPQDSGERFADEQCMQPLLGWSDNACVAVPRLLTRAEGVGCAAADVVYEVGEVVPAGTFFRRVGDVCERDPGTPFFSPQRRLTVFDPKKLIEFSESTARLGPLEAVIGKSRDGASVLLQLRDGATGAPCTPRSIELQNDPAGAVACFPAMTSVLGPPGAFTGPTCSAPAVHSFVWPQCEGTMPATPKVVRVFQQGASCEVSDSEFFALGAPVERAYVQGSTCEPSAWTFPAYEIGEKIDPLRFPAVDVTVSGSTLETSSWQVAGREVVLPSSFWLDGTSCTVTDFADGTKRCVPSSAISGGRLYADPACTSLAFPAPELSCSSPTYLVAHESQTCAWPATRVFLVGRKLTGATLYFKQTSPEACVPNSQPSMTAWEAGEEVDPTRFPAVTAITP